MDARKPNPLKQTETEGARAEHQDIHESEVSKDDPISAAILQLQEAHVQGCHKYQDVLRDDGPNCAEWAKYQDSLVQKSIEGLTSHFDVSYWNYFFDAKKVREIDREPVCGHVYFAEDKNRDHVSRTLFTIWRTTTGRGILQKAGIPRLADILRFGRGKDTVGYLVSPELPWCFSFSPTCHQVFGPNQFVIQVDESVTHSILDRSSKMDYPLAANTLSEFVSTINKDTTVVSSLRDSLISSLATRNKSVEANEILKRAEMLARYLGWMIAALGKPPCLAMYFPGSAGYESLPDIGCALGFTSPRNLDAKVLDKLAAFVDLSLYYSLLPFAPIQEEASRRFKRASHLRARASIMSRNFSHNVGSHSLASPRLHESISITKVKHPFEKRFMAAELETDEAAVSRVRIIIQQRLAAFHSYAQGRLDFLARAISEFGNRPEPLFFLNDVLERGFFMQGVLLDTLIEDAGFAAHEIEFDVSIQKVNKVDFWGARYEWNPERHQFSRDKHSAVEDVVVGIPGGMIGAHALYAFLENVMRNSVKYGHELHGSKDKKKKLKLRIHLRLEQCKGLRDDKPEAGWVLSVWDNVSSDATGNVARNIRGHINESLIDQNSGDMRTQGHGIQEMKLCAELLSGGEKGLRFPSDHDGYDPIEQDRCAHCEKSCTASQEYTRYGRAIGEGGIDDPQPLRCYSAPHLNETKWLTYNLFIPIPVLLGIVSPANAKKTERLNLPPHIRYCQTVRELAESGAHIGVLLDDGLLPEIQTTKEIALLHPCLPFRLMVVTPRELDDVLPPSLNAEITSRNPWKTAIHNCQKPIGEPFNHPIHIPARRLRVCGRDLGRTLTALLSDPQEDSETTFLEAGGKGQPRWDAIVLRAYDAWLQIYKPLPISAEGTWKLCIGFEHGGAAVGDRWRSLLHRFGSNTVDKPCVGVHVISKAHKDDTTPSRASSVNLIAASDNRQLFDSLQVRALEFLLAKEKAEETPFSEKHLLLFDNHGDVFSGFKGHEYPFRKGVRFYQKIGLKDGLSLYQSLESPPQSAFGFALFVYSLAEGALTRIAILDERVSQATLESGEIFRDPLHFYHTADLFPLLRFCPRNVPNSKPVFISNRLESSATDTGTSWTETGGDEKEWNSLLDPHTGEGFHFSTDSTCIGVVKSSFNNVKKAIEINDIDVLVFHEGVADRLNSESEGVWKESDTSGLFSAAPCIVRTSGRGQESRHLRNILPFIEFTELSENTYQGMNKVGLTKCLLGTTGNIRVLDKESKPL